MALPKLGGHLIVFGPRYTMDNDAEFILDSVKAAGYTAVASDVGRDPLEGHHGRGAGVLGDCDGRILPPRQEACASSGSHVVHSGSGRSKLSCCLGCSMG